MLIKHFNLDVIGMKHQFEFDRDDNSGKFGYNG